MARFVLTPMLEEPMSYKVLDIYRDLPRTNTGDCGRGNCFAFASAVYLEGAPLTDCPHLSPEHRAQMEAKLEAGRARGEGRKPEAIRQAWNVLEAEVSAADFSDLAARCGAKYAPGAREALELALVGRPVRIVRTGPSTVAIEAPDDDRELEASVRVLLLLYAGRSKGTPKTGEWASPRELPLIRPKAAEFEVAATRVAERFGGRLDELDDAVHQFGGARREPADGAPDRSYRLPALPLVDLLLLVWGGTDEFAGRAAFLVDRSLPDHLAAEPASFVAALAAARLLGEF